MFLDDIIAEIEADIATPGAHSDIGASGANIWFNCPASVQLSAGQPSTTSQSAVEGTFYHKLGELMLLDSITTLDLSSYIDERVTLQGYNFKISEQMIDGVEIYSNYVKTKVKSKPFAVLSVERKFKLLSVDPKAFGTGDATINEPYVSLETVDLKTGRGLVSPDSKQLKYYALGELEDCDTEFNEIKLTIVQPKEVDPKYKVKTFRLTRAELMEFKEELKTAIARVRSAKPTDTNMGDWCTFCKGKGVCDKQQEAARKLMEVGFDDITEVAHVATMPPELVQWCVDNGDRAKKFIDLAIVYATEQAKVGLGPIGYKLINSTGNRRWFDGVEPAIENELGEEAYKVTKKLQTPAQAEAILAKKLNITKDAAKKRLSEYFFAPDNGVKLVPQSDRGQAVTFFDDVVSTSII